MSMAAPAVDDRARRALYALVGALALLCVAWELVLAPLRPGGSWLALKALPLALLLPGLIEGKPRTMQVTTLVVLLYLAEGALRLGDPAPAGTLAVIELLLAAAVFAAAVVCLAPYRRAARERRATRSKR